MTREALGNALAHVNAGLNLTSAVLLITGFVLIRSGRVQSHRRAMLGAVTASSVFLVFYVIRFSLSGAHRFAGEGLAKTLYLWLLFSHMVLAVVIVPLIVRLLWLALHDRRPEHRRLARWTFPLWMYVSVTGLTVYTLLYHVYGYL